MADESQIGEEIARNLVPDPRLTKILPGGVNVVQSVMSGGMGVSLERGEGDGEAYATPWVDAGSAAGDKVCVLIVSSNTLQPPAGGVSLDDGDDGSGLVWLRGASTGYAEVMAVRCADPAACRLHAPASGVLTIVKSGVFDMDSWSAMQERGIIYFDGGGIIQASESGYTLPPATASTLGGVIVGDGLQVTPQGVLSVIPQDLPTATQDTAGVVKAGNGVRVKSDGTLEIRLGKNLSFDTSGNIDAAGGSQSVDLSDYYTRSEVDGKFLTKELAEATYATKDEIPSGGGGSDLSGYATENWVESNYLSQSDARSQYQEKLPNSSGGGAGNYKWRVVNGVCSLSVFATLNAGQSTVSIGSVSSQYAPPHQMDAYSGFTGSSGSGGVHIQVNTSGSITAYKSGSSSDSGQVFASFAWGVE